MVSRSDCAVSFVKGPTQTHVARTAFPLLLLKPLESIARPWQDQSSRPSSYGHNTRYSWSNPTPPSEGPDFSLPRNLACGANSMCHRQSEARLREVEQRIVADLKESLLPEVARLPA